MSKVAVAHKGHDPAEVDRTRLTGPLEQVRGVIGREPAPDEAFVFPFDEVARRPVHMVGVRKPLRVEWHVDDRCVRTEELAPWTGYASHRADTVVERGVGDDG